MGETSKEARVLLITLFLFLFFLINIYYYLWSFYNSINVSSYDPYEYYYSFSDCLRVIIFSVTGFSLIFVVFFSDKLYIFDRFLLYLKKR